MGFGLAAILSSRTVAGFSRKTQVLFQAVFLSRYLDIFTQRQGSYLLFFKISFNLITAFMLWCFHKLHITYDSAADSCNLLALVLPTAIIAFLSGGEGLREEAWTFSELLEPLALIPQYIMCYRATRVRPAAVIYVLAVGGYRTLYVCNWIYKRYVWHGAYHDYTSWIGGALECIIFADFLFRISQRREVIGAIGASPLGRVILSLDDGAGRISEKIEMKAIGRRIPFNLSGPGSQDRYRKIWAEFCPGGSESESPDRLVARFLIRAAQRRLQGLTLRRVPVIVCGYRPKFLAVDRAFAKLRHRVAILHPHCATRSADDIADLLDAQHILARGVVPFVDCAVALADEMNARLGVGFNRPETSSLRRDKFLQQAVLHRVGLPAPEQIVTAEASAACAFLALHGTVVLKPRDASGGDGVCLCRCPEDISTAFEQELGKEHQELGVNTELIVTEALLGEEWVINTVSRRGVHKVTDAWCGPSKTLIGAGPEHFVYNVQYLAGESERMLQVVQMVKDSLTVLGLWEGAAHTELVWVDGTPYIYEVNARCSGGLPRGPPPTQLDVLAMSLFDESRFLALPEVPSADVANQAAVVFLKSPLEGWLTAEALERAYGLKTFAFFERGLQECRPPFHSHRVHLTVGLSTCPGAVVLQGCSEEVLRDVQLLRQVETTAYIEQLPV
ncbi:unnamed protein product [Effrenium voratum]|nr:unnamed protein product [Effrenium voratum]